MALAVLKLASDVTNITPPHTISWPAAVLDELGAYSGAAPTRLTVPSGVTHVVLYAIVAGRDTGTATQSMDIEIRLNGSSGVVGNARSAFAQAESSTQTCRVAQTCILPVSAGDWFDCSVQVPVAGVSDILSAAAFPTLFVMRSVASVAGAMTYLTSDETGLSGVTAATWDAESYDTGAIWSAGAPSNWVIPSGAARAAVTANLQVAGYAPAPDVSIARNGTIFSALKAGVGNHRSLYTGPFAVSPGDVVTLVNNTADTNYERRSASTSASIEILSRDCCAVSLSGDLTTVNADTSPPYITAWSSELFDDMSAWSSGSPARLTSPGGRVKAGATIFIELIGNLDYVYLNVRHFNSSGTLLGTYGNPMLADTAIPHQASAWTPDIDTAAGDYFDTALELDGDTSITIKAASRFWMEVFEDPELALGPAASTIELDAEVDDFIFGLPLGPAASTIDLDAEADAFEFVIGLSGSATVSLDAEADLFTALGLSGASQITLDAEADLQLGTVLLGSAEITLDAAADLGVGTPLGLTTATLSLLAAGDLTVETRLVGMTTVTLDAEADLVLGTDLGATDATLNIFAREAGGAARAGAFFLLF